MSKHFLRLQELAFFNIWDSYVIKLLSKNIWAQSITEVRSCKTGGGDVVLIRGKVIFYMEKNVLPGK